MSFRSFTARSVGIVTARAAIGSARRFPRHGVAGLVMMLVGWVCAWLPTHPLSAGSFILLWVGFIFAVDELVLWRRGTSLWQDHRWKFVQLFLFSVPVWWLFEGLNIRVQNCHYILDQPYGYRWTSLTYNLMATACFSTVLPAVMEVASFLTSFAPLRPRLVANEAEPVIPASWLMREFGGGIFMILASLIWPHIAFGLIWLVPLLLLDAINAANHRRSAIGHLIAGDWRFVAALALSALVCGFFWEMWNFWSLPKWYYTIPYVGFAKIFEMPVLGFSGYLPFGVELFALYQILLWLTRQRDDALPF